MIWARLVGPVLLTLALVGCASKQVSVETEATPSSAEDISFAEQALKVRVSDSLAVRPSWVYYQYGLQAIDNQEWSLARHYLDNAMRLLVSEKFDSLYCNNVSRVEDSLYRAEMPLRIVRALDEVFPNLPNSSQDEQVYMQNEVSIEGVETIEEKEADSASLQIIENFLDTLDVSQFSLPVEFNERVLQEIFYMTTQARAFMEGSLNRKTAYDSLIYAKLMEYNMPKDLIFLALVESGFKVKAYSRAKASGMWQFIPETGKRYGLEVDFWVDMRRNPEKATMAALKYLNRLHDEFDDWLLAMAAYNCGEGRVRRLLKEMKEDSTRDTSIAITYWDLELPKETMRYVPRILAAMVIGHYPSEYDMTVVQHHMPEFDTVTVFDSFPLEEVAKVIKVKEDSIRDLNMELVKWCTPPNKDSYLLRLPVGTRDAFIEGYDKMEKNNFSSWHKHKVRKGENLGVIARQYGIKVAEIQQANDMKGTRLRIGQSLLIPIKVEPKKKTSTKKPTKVKNYVVKLGDNLASIGRRYGVSAETLRIWNSMADDAQVKMGDTIFVSKPDLKPSISTSIVTPLKKGERYGVRAGDTYAAIAKAYNVPVLLLMQENDGFTKRLQVGDSLEIPELPAPRKAKKSKSLEVLSAANDNAPKKNKEMKDITPVQTTIYVVEAGDNLFNISRKFGTTVDEIQRLNDLGSSTNINVGQRLKIAGSSTHSLPTETASGEAVHTVQKGEGLWDIARQYKVTIEDIVKWNNLKDTKIKAGDKLKIRK
ncbi:MAG: LysM peptidoglycan-binding domain-containing protein [Fibrobacteraceae bacterium]|nr:LysM peptidoglycan-binding domain-containing protein [Fibrobacteraceae bacterium]